MKLCEFYDAPTPEQLEEKALRKIAATAALAATLATSGSLKGADADKPPQEPAAQTQTQTVSNDDALAKRMRMAWPEIDIPAPTLVKRVELARNIASEYRVDLDLVQQIVDTAFRLEDKEFPKAADILAIIGVESSFNPNSRSSLRHDPAIGLMQVRPGIWDLKPSDLASIEDQIKHGAHILKRYYRKTGSAEDAIQAYNLGITSFRRGDRNPRYVAKYNQFMASNF